MDVLTINSWRMVLFSGLCPPSGVEIFFGEPVDKLLDPVLLRNEKWDGMGWDGYCWFVAKRVCV